MSRVSGIPWIGPPLRGVLNSITDIPNLYPFRDLSGATLGVKLLERAARQGLGRSIVGYLREHDLALLTTFYSPVVLADFHGYDRIFCVVTDSDVNRVWAPINPKSSKIRYLAPSGRVVRRLRAYGVPEAQIELTGFPLPHSLVGGPEATTLRRNLAALGTLGSHADVVRGYHFHFADAQGAGHVDQGPLSKPCPARSPGCGAVTALGPRLP